ASGDSPGDDEAGFEQSFSQLAHTYLQSKAPGLMDYEVGFQLVDKSEDDSKALAVTVFKVGDMWLYAPVFFIDGDLKGHELLYIKNQDLFVPLLEEWLNYLLNRRPHQMGKPVSKNLREHGVLPPNLYQLKYPPSKYASERQDKDANDKAHKPHSAALAAGAALAGAGLHHLVSGAIGHEGQHTEQPNWDDAIRQHQEDPLHYDRKLPSHGDGGPLVAK